MTTPAVTTLPEIIVTLAPGPAAPARLSAVLAQAPIATVIITTATGTHDIAEIRELIALAQAADVAALTTNDAKLARTLRADGTFLRWNPNSKSEFEEARETLGNRFIVGIDAGASRHDAMSLGEAGAEFIAFGPPVDATDAHVARSMQLELIEWWAEIFEVPCVALDIMTTDDAHDAAAAGADFLAIPMPEGLVPADVAAHVVELRAAAHAGAATRRVRV